MAHLHFLCVLWAAAAAAAALVPTLTPPYNTSNPAAGNRAHIEVRDVRLERHVWDPSGVACQSNTEGGTSLDDCQNLCTFFREETPAQQTLQPLWSVGWSSGNCAIQVTNRETDQDMVISLEDAGNICARLVGCIDRQYFGLYYAQADPLGAGMGNLNQYWVFPMKNNSNTAALKHAPAP